MSCDMLECVFVPIHTKSSFDESGDDVYKCSFVSGGGGIIASKGTTGTFDTVSVLIGSSPTI